MTQPINKSANSKAHLIKLLHVAKTKLQMDDDSYRANLAAVSNGKTSSKELTILQLEAALSRFQQLGFKPLATGKKRLSPSSKDQPDERSVIRALWIFMAEQRFIRDSSETALNSYIKRMTAQKNGGEGIAECTWLRYEDAAYVVNTLKFWAKREMIKSLGKTGELLRYKPYQQVLKIYLKQQEAAVGH